MYLSDLHTHTIASGHGTNSTITAMAREASKRGLKLLGITDHGPATLSSATDSYFRSLSTAPKRRFDLDLLFGAECSILDETGKLDLSDEVLSLLDYCIASLHPHAKKPEGKEKDTKAVLAALEHPAVRILGHLDDTAYVLDYASIIQKCAQKNVILEMNEASLCPGSYRGDTKENASEMLRLCATYQLPILLSSDSHGPEGVGEFPYAERFVHESLFPEKLILNNQLPRLRMLLSLRPPYVLS